MCGENCEVIFSGSHVNCSCLPGWKTDESNKSGKTCDINIDDCDSARCAANAACIDGIDGYACFCSPGFIGQYCTIDEKQCDYGLCQNNAECEEYSGTFVCRCSDNYVGTYCEKRKSDITDEGKVHQTTEQQYTSLTTVFLNIPTTEQHASEIRPIDRFQTTKQNLASITSFSLLISPTTYDDNDTITYDGGDHEVYANGTVSLPSMFFVDYTDPLLQHETKYVTQWHVIRQFSTNALQQKTAVGETNRSTLTDSEIKGNDALNDATVSPHNIVKFTVNYNGTFNTVNGEKNTFLIDISAMASYLNNSDANFAPEAASMPRTTEVNDSALLLLQELQNVQDDNLIYENNQHANDSDIRKYS